MIEISLTLLSEISAPMSLPEIVGTAKASLGNPASSSTRASRIIGSGVDEEDFTMIAFPTIVEYTNLFTASERG